MNNIVCVKWGKLYSAEYVNNLYCMVKRNTTEPFRFVCFTDDTTGIHSSIETKPLVDKSLKGWWTKIAFFQSPLFDIEGDVLLIDLDMVIVDNIDCFFEHEPERFCMKWDNPGHGHSSCVMRFEANKYSHIYDNLDLSKIAHADDNTKPGFKNNKYWGDQIWITEQMKDVPKKEQVVNWPKAWIPKFSIDCHREIKSKKIFADIPCSQRKQGEFFVPDDAKIIAFAGPNGNNKRHATKISKWWHSNDIGEV